MHKSLTLFIAFSLLTVGSVWAGPVQFTVTMNTSSIAGTPGSIDFAFDPGAGSDQFATATVEDFSTDIGTYDGSQTLTGNAAGGPVIPGASLTLLANSTTADNDDLETFTYGNTLSFVVDLSGPALSAPDGSASSPYEFIFSTYSDPLGITPVLTTDPGGASAVINISDEGVVSTRDVSPQATIAASPEPATLWLLAGALGLLAIARLVHRNLIEQA